MTALALGLVLAAATLHATWNCAAKRSSGGLPFVWLSSAMNVSLYLPVLAVYCWWQRPSLPVAGWLAIGGSGLIKTAYALLLQSGYRHGDFSLIYPLARGTGPLLSTLAAIAIFGERPTPLALAGGLVVVVSIFVLTGGPAVLRRDRAFFSRGVAYGLLCGLCIAGYTVWDQRAVSHLQLPPILYDGGTSLVMFTILTPFARARRPAVGREWREHRGLALTVAVLSAVSYVLILTAMSFTPVSYVAPAREVSILIGTLFGARLLRESEARRRLPAAAGMVLGVIALALG